MAGRVRVEWFAQRQRLTQDETSRTKNAQWLGVWFTFPDRFNLVYERANGIEYRAMSCSVCYKDPLDCECEVYGSYIERVEK